MECLFCKSDALHGEVTVTRLLPLTARGNSVKIGGLAITQIDMKNAWHQTKDGATKDILSPIHCVACSGVMHYVVGASNPLREGPAPVVKEEGEDE